MPQEGLRIDLLGTSFSIKTDKDPVYLQKLIERYKRVLEDTQKGTGLVDPVKVSILAGIVLCDEIEKNRNDTDLFDKAESERITANLIARLNEAIKD